MLPDNIVISTNIATELSGFLNNHRFTQVVVLVDENTKENCLHLIRSALSESFHLVEIESGERQKNIETCHRIWQSLTKAGCDRQSLMVNLGGGVIGDMGGFCAATFKRGIPFINIPTTLLAQVDASIGGKLGIDFHAHKNHIGLFQDPDKVFIDHAFLSTLDKRELYSGFAEVVKHALIRSRDQWDMILHTSFQEIAWKDIIPGSIKIKADIVAKDRQEKGERKLLNFGHTIGHAIESYFLHETAKQVLHGEAIAAGMICETYISHKKTNLPESDLQEISKFLQESFPYLEIKSSAEEKILEFVWQDKKNVGRNINCTLLAEKGRGIFDQPITADDIKDAFKYYRKAAE